MANIGLGLSGLITGAAGTVAGLWQNYQNNKMMQKQMDYNTSEREASQRYNTSEREASQQYQTSEREAQNKYNEDMYNKYSSPQAMVEQYKAAGLNPRLAANGDGLGTSVSGGSNGGAPSGAAPSGTHINPPYQNMSAMADSFATMTQGLQALAAAKKAGVETMRIQKFMDKELRGVELSNISQELANSLQEVELNVKQQTALKQAFAVLNDTNASWQKKQQELENLKKVGLLTQKQVDTFDEKFKNEQENIKSSTDANRQGIDESKHRILNIDADSMLKRAQSITESTKPALNKALTSFHNNAARLNDLDYRIRSSSSKEEIERNKAEYKKLLHEFTRDSHYLLTEIESLENDPGTLGELFESGNFYGFVSRAVLEAKNLIKFW